jgi:hypothetical protein
VPVGPTAAAGSNTAQLATTAFVANSATVYQTLAAAKVATTASFSPFPPISYASIDGYTVVAGDRVLVKDQGTGSIVTIGASGTGVTATLTFSAIATAIPVGTNITVAGVTPTGYNGTYVVTATSTTSVSYANITTGSQTVAGTIGYTLANANNGVYVVAASGTAWARATDANTAAKLAAAQVPVLRGTINGGLTFTTPFKSTDTLSTSGTAMLWSAVDTANGLQTLTNKTINALQLVDGTITAPKLNGGQSGSAPVYGPRAWAQFSANPADMTTTSNLPFSRVAGSADVTITQNSHSFSAGQALYFTFSTGITTGFYVITSVTTNTFTIASMGTTAVNGTVAYSKCLIKASGNIAFIACRPDYPTTNVINFLEPMPDANFAWSGSASGLNVNGVAWMGGKYGAGWPNTTTVALPQTTKYAATTTVYAYQESPPTSWLMNNMSFVALR